MNCAGLMKRRGIVMLERKGYIRNLDGTLEPNFSTKMVGHHPVTREPIRKVVPGSARAVLENAPKPFRPGPINAERPLEGIVPFAPALRSHGLLSAVIAAVSDFMGRRPLASDVERDRLRRARGAKRGI